MTPIRRAALTAAIVTATAALAASPVLAAESGSSTPSGAVTSTKTPTHNGVASPGPHNPGARLPESGQIPGAPGHGDGHADTHAGASLKSPGEGTH